jgi:hypothetical protein
MFGDLRKTYTLVSPKAVMTINYRCAVLSNTA